MRSYSYNTPIGHFPDPAIYSTNSFDTFIVLPYHTLCNTLKKFETSHGLRGANSPSLQCNNFNGLAYGSNLNQSPFCSEGFLDVAVTKEVDNSGHDSASTGSAQVIVVKEEPVESCTPVPINCTGAVLTVKCENSGNCSTINFGSIDMNNDVENTRHLQNESYCIGNDSELRAENLNKAIDQANFSEHNHDNSDKSKECDDGGVLLQDYVDQLNDGDVAIEDTYHSEENENILTSNKKRVLHEPSSEPSIQVNLNTVGGHSKQGDAERVPFTVNNIKKRKHSSAVKTKKQRKLMDYSGVQKVGTNAKKKRKRPNKANIKVADADHADCNVLKEVKNRISIKLHEHPDKYTTEYMVSMERRDRAKPKEEITEEVYVCRMCDVFQTATKDVIENHLEEHVNGDLDCKKCDFKAKSRWNRVMHMNKVHQDSAGIVCHLCGMMIFGTISYKTHLGKIHNRPQFKCRVCDDLFAITRLCKKHENCVHRDMVKWCDKCQLRKLNMTTAEFVKHLSECTIKGYPCEKCGKLFKNSACLGYHINCVHRAVRTFPCPKCPFTSKKNSGLQRHLKTHDGIHPYKCDQCTFSCVQHCQLKSHMRTHTGHKPFKCDECNYAASWNVQLKDHRKIHGLPCSVVCDDCGVLFKNNRTLAMHVKKEHPKTAGVDGQQNVASDTEA